MSTYNIGRQAKTLLRKVEPTHWYSPASLVRFEVAKTLIQEVIEDPSHIYRERNCSVNDLLGASILNYAVRHDLIEMPDMSTQNRFANPVQLAHCLEIKLVDLMQHGSGRVITYVNSGSEPDYGVDVTEIHRYGFSNVSHSGLEELSDEDILMKHRVSGKHQDYQDLLFGRYIRLVHKRTRIIASKLPSNVTPESLLGAATLGFIRAIETYSFEKGMPFVMFVSRRIDNGTWDSLRADDLVPRTVRQNNRDIQKHTAKFYAENGRLPTHNEVMKGTGITEGALISAHNLSQPGAFSSLESRFHGEGLPLSERLADTKAKDGDSLVSKLDQEEKIRRAIALLPKEDAEILVMYFWEDMTLAEIGAKCGYTDSNASLKLGAVLKELSMIADLDEVR